MKLGKFFTLEELTATKTGLQNIPTKIEIEKLKALVQNVLDPVRAIYGQPIKINSGYRSPNVNKSVGGSKTSQHVKGEAADITCSDNIFLFNLIKDNFEFDQLINEYNYSWIHVSFKGSGNRKQVLIIK